MPDKQNSLPDSYREPSWKNLSASNQASFRLSLMLAEMEFEGRNYLSAADYFLKALKLHFRTDIYKQTVISIRYLPKKQQVDFLYRLGKCLLVHCNSSGRAQEILHKLSTLDPSFLWPAQKIFMMFENGNSIDQRRIKVILEETAEKQGKMEQVTSEPAPTPVPALKPALEAGLEPAPTSEPVLEAGLGPALELEKEVEITSKKDKIMQSELQISFEETGEHFTVNKNITDSTTIDKKTLGILMDDLLQDE